MRAFISKLDLLELFMDMNGEMEEIVEKVIENIPPGVYIVNRRILRVSGDGVKVDSDPVDEIPNGDVK